MVEQEAQEQPQQCRQVLSSFSDETSPSALIEFIHDELHAAYRHAHQLAERLNRGKGGRETSLCITKIEEAVHRIKDAEKQLEEEFLRNGVF